MFQGIIITMKQFEEYKYDNNGNLVTKAAFDYNQVVYTAVTNGYVAYKGNFFVTIKENLFITIMQ